jgi:formate hydrogenlyase subunit 6/NADH:ubiquinone oxidoreductase subunit I
MSILNLLLRNFTQGPSTDPFPFGETFTPDALRGRVEFDAVTCTACKFCEKVCVGGSIRFAKVAGGTQFTLWHNTCTFCGLCQFYCPTEAIRLTTDWHLSHLNAEKYSMVEMGFLPTIKCTQCGTEATAMAPRPDQCKRPLSADELNAYRHLCPKCRRTFLQGIK